MCMLTFIPGGVMPTAEALRNGAEQNDDGHGFAIVADGRLVIRKSMDADFLIAEFTRLRSKHLAGPALFHSRWGTGGTVDQRNCHPFRFGGDKLTVVGHNGVLGNEVQPDKGDKRCDTRIAAEEVIPYFFGHLSEPAGRDALAEWIGDGNKFVILTANPAYPASAYIINEDKGIWDADGCWYSNLDYIGRPRRHAGASWGYDSAAWALDAIGDDGGYAEYQCGFCRTASLDPDGICQDCGTCVDCENDYTDCDCFYGSEAGREAMIRRHEDRDQYRGFWERELAAEAEADAGAVLDGDLMIDRDHTLDDEMVVMGPRPAFREAQRMDTATRDDMLGIALASLGVDATGTKEITS